MKENREKLRNIYIQHIYTYKTPCVVDLQRDSPKLPLMII